MSGSGELKDFDVCVDKGTFDAISLNPENTNEVRIRYVQALGDALKEGGYFVITSCNWTKEQLLHRFCSGNGSLIRNCKIYSDVFPQNAGINSYSILCNFD